MNNVIGNLSTVVKTISMAIAGWFIGILISHGLDLGIDASQLSEVIATIIFIGIAYIDAKYPNSFSFLGNSKTINPVTDEPLNYEYVTGSEEDE